MSFSSFKTGSFAVCHPAAVMKSPPHQSGPQLLSLFPFRHLKFSPTSPTISVFFYSIFTPLPDSLTPSLFIPFSTASLVLSSVAAARQDTDVRWAFLKGPRSSALVLSLLSLSPLALLCFHFHKSSLSLCLFVSPPAYRTPTPFTPLPPFTSHESQRLTASPKSESWNRWNMNGSLVYEKGVWVKEVV